MRLALTYPDVRRSGGIERVVMECANYLQGGGRELYLLASRVQADAVTSGVIVNRVPSPRRPAVLAMPQYRRGAARALRRLGTGVDVHASFGSQSPGGGVFWVPSVHRAALDMILSRRGCAGRLRQQLNPDHIVRLRLEESHFRRRDYARLIACTEAVKGDLIRYHDVPPEDVELLPLGFRPSEFNAKRRIGLREEARARLGVDDSTRIVLFVGNELERKGFGRVLEALALIGDSDVRLFVVGAVSNHHYKADLDRLQLAGRVTFTGPAADVAFFHAAADIFALPTLYEPWGLVIVEALASGLPVVTTALAGAASVVTPDTGRVLGDAEDAAALAAAIQEVLAGGTAAPAAISRSVEELSWPRVLSRYEQILSACRT